MLLTWWIAADHKTIMVFKVTDVKSLLNELVLNHEAMNLKPIVKSHSEISTLNNLLIPVSKQTQECKIEIKSYLKKNRLSKQV